MVVIEDEEAAVLSLLPEEIIVTILSMLPVKSILRFRCVCKSWCKLSGDPKFVKLHLNHAIEQNNFTLLLDNYKQIYSLDYDSSSSTFGEAVEINYPFKPPEYGFRIWGVCNGLCCLRTVWDDSISIWNPSTREYKNIPSPPNEFPGSLCIGNAMGMYAFMYDYKMDDYMLVRFVNFVRSSEGLINVYTFGSNSWKSIKNGHYRISSGFDGIVLLNGALHWTAIPSGGQDPEVIISFDIGDERFGELPLPEHLDARNQLISVGESEGCLRVIGHHYKIRTEVWVMKDYGVKESWTKMFTINHQTLVGSACYLTLIQSFKNGEVLLQMGARTLVLYDQYREKARILKIPGISRQFSTMTYFGSLVSLNSVSSSAEDHS